MRSLSDAHARAYPQKRLNENGNSLSRIGILVPTESDSCESPGVGAAPTDAAPGGEAAGLVYSQTSGTDPLPPSNNMGGTYPLPPLFLPHGEKTGESNTNKARPEIVRIDREKTRLKRLKCSVLTAARLHVQQRSRWKVAMLTLTYRPDVEWAPGQVSTVVRHIRQYLARRGVEMRHVWVQEFTKKGRPHYHMLLWLPLGITLPKPDKRGWWAWGMTKIEWARNAVGYIAKYASKGDSLHLPAKGARMHGSGGLTDDALLEQRWWRLPGWLRGDVTPSDRVRRAVVGSGGGFVHPTSGEVYRSPWVVFFKGGSVFIRRQETV